MVTKYKTFISLFTICSILFAIIFIAPQKAYAVDAIIDAVESQGAEFNFLKSNKFEVRLSNNAGSSWKNSFTYLTTYNIVEEDVIYESSRVGDTVSYTDFSSDFSGEVTVEVKLLTGNINTVVIRPLNYNITPTINSNTVTFTLSTAQKVSVEINEDANGYTKHRLFVFANELEIVPPIPGDLNVYKFSYDSSKNINNRTDFNSAWTDPNKTIAYFEKGIHYITEDSFIPSNKTIYLAPGAYVYGSFKSTDSTWKTSYSNITIKGRGILDSFYGGYSQIWLQGANNKVDGVMLLHKYKGPKIPYPENMKSSVSAVWLIGGSGTVENTKVINWMHAGGIFGLSGTFTVNNCFIFTNDDCIDISFPEKSIITNNTTWNYYNGSALCFSWNSTRSPHQAYVNNLNVIHWDSKFDDPGCTCGNAHDSTTGAKIAVFFASHDSSVALKNFTIENVRIEKMSSDSTKRFLSLCVYDNRYSVQSEAQYHGRTAFGAIQDGIFKNITIDGTTTGNVIHGYDDNAKVSNITFENLKINNSIASSFENANISVNQYTSDIKFIEENKISNWSFEANTGYAASPTGWSSSGDVNTDYSNGPGDGFLGDNSGNHYKSDGAYNVTTYQTVTGLSNGSYTATARVLSSGGQSAAKFIVSDFGGTTKETNISSSSVWTLVKIQDILVSNGQCKISFYSDSPAQKYIKFDDVQLYKQQGINFMNQLYTGTRNNFTGQLGYKFRPNRDIIITALGRSGLGMNWSHGIKVFRVSNSAYIAGVIVSPLSSTDNLGYKYAKLANSVTLLSGVDYYITSTESSGGDVWMDWGTISNHTSDCAILGSIWDVNISGCPSSSNFGSSTDKGYCAPVFYIGTGGPTELEILGTSTLVSTGEFVYGISESTTVADLKANFANSEYIVITGAVGNIVGTGCVISLVVNDVTIDTLSVIIKGDVSGNGVIGLEDLVLIRDDLLEISPLTGNSYLAGNLYGELSITLNDLVGIMADVSENSSIIQ